MEIKQEIQEILERAYNIIDEAIEDAPREVEMGVAEGLEYILEAQRILRRSKGE